jgi:hypothetical protein
MIRNTVRQIKTAEPAISEVQMDLLTKSPLRPDAKAIPHQQHPDQQFWVNRRATSMAVEIRYMRTDAAQIDKPNNRPQQMILWNMIFQRELIKQSRLRLLLWSHHRQSSSSLEELNQQIELRSRESFSTKLGGLQTFAASARWECVNSES